MYFIHESNFKIVKSVANNKTISTENMFTKYSVISTMSEFLTLPTQCKITTRVLISEMPSMTGQIRGIPSIHDCNRF